MKTRSPAEWGRECLAGLPNDARYLVGVSGGRDSVVLLRWLLAQGYRRLIVCHFEHGLRGRAGKGDARFVERLAAAQGLKFEPGSADIAALAAKRKQSIETAARQERLAFFTRVGCRRHCATLFLGHQADDQVETFLLNLFRGAGARGLGAMRAGSDHGYLRIVRPLLGVWREEIDGYAQRERLRYRDDATNEVLHARRNRVRHKVIPRLEKEFGRTIRSTIWRASAILAEEDDFLETLTPVGLTNQKELNVAELRSLLPPLQRRAIRKWLVQQEISGTSFDVVEGIKSLIAGGAPAKINLPRGRHVRRRSGRIFLE
ncbi:MAG: tRNA lysidine(34) synthetase TilS [Spartobacteria bacterium]